MWPYHPLGTWRRDHRQQYGTRMPAMQSRYGDDESDRLYSSGQEDELLMAGKIELSVANNTMKKRACPETPAARPGYRVLEHWESVPDRTFSVVCPKGHQFIIGANKLGQRGEVCKQCRFGPNGLTSHIAIGELCRKYNLCYPDEPLPFLRDDIIWYCQEGHLFLSSRVLIKSTPAGCNPCILCDLPCCEQKNNIRLIGDLTAASNSYSVLLWQCDGCSRFFFETMTRLMDT